MDLKNLFNEIEKLENQLENQLRKKQINFERQLPKASKIKDIVVFGGNQIFDAFTSYMIKDEEYDNEIYSLQEKLLADQTLLIKEIQRMKKYDDTIPLIVYLREEKKWNWREIDKFLNYSDDVSRIKYFRYKKIN